MILYAVLRQTAIVAGHLVFSTFEYQVLSDSQTSFTLTTKQHKVGILRIF